MTFGPSDRWYDPPEPPQPCCALAEDDPEHDQVACLAVQAEDDADRRADLRREYEMWAEQDMRDRDGA